MPDNSLKESTQTTSAQSSETVDSNAPTPTTPTYEPLPETEVSSDEIVPKKEPGEGMVTTATSAQVKGKSSTKRVVVTILAILLLVAGVATGVYLVSQQQEIRTKAGDKNKNSETNPNTSNVSVQCQKINAYDGGWMLLSEEDLANLKAGDEVYFAISCTPSEGALDKARFSINDKLTPELSDKKPETGEFFYKYTIEQIDVESTITVYGWVHSSISNSWY